MRDFLHIKPENIEKICTAIIKQNKTTILVMAMERLTLLAYYVKHQERTSHNNKELTHITSDDLDGLAHHMEVELNWDKKNKTPEEPTPVNLDETYAHKAFSNMQLLLAGMRGHNNVPLSYVIRPRILPPDWGQHDPNYQPRFGAEGSPYTSIDDELTLRAPILKENRRKWHNFTNLETLEETELRTQAYHTDNAAVFSRVTGENHLHGPTQEVSQDQELSSGFPYFLYLLLRQDDDRVYARQDLEEPPVLQV